MPRRRLRDLIAKLIGPIADISERLLAQQLTDALPRRLIETTLYESSDDPVTLPAPGGNGALRR